MKLIKKIAAIMFAFMMVVSMSCNVKAVEGTSPATKGTITITGAKKGETYKLYKILSLESYSYTENDKDNGNYAYTLTGDGWNNFITGTGILNEYFEYDETGIYLKWKGNKDAARVEAFAQLALKFARNEEYNVQPVQTAQKATSDTVIYSGLDLGYYLVDSSMGTLCALTTTNQKAEIVEKNTAPTVEKKVGNSAENVNSENNTASIGDTVYFQTTITAQPGAQNYVLHDKMDAGLNFNENSVKAILNKNETKKELTVTDYSVVTRDLEDTDPKCTFHIKFSQLLCDSLAANDTITVTYTATLDEDALIAGDGNKNETWLKYGNSQNTQHKTTTTKTFEMNVFKYTEDKTDETKKDGLADAVFTLKKDGEINTINFVKEKTDETNGDVYRVANTGDANITTNKSGKFTIKGLGAGTYYLTETKQPAGYNKLKNPVTVVIDNDGNVKVDDANADPVEVENKTGTVLPSTGGVGTTMIYLVGAVLVLGSGVVLATKRRVKNK